jgi:hypothetical protein
VERLLGPRIAGINSSESADFHQKRLAAGLAAAIQLCEVVMINSSQEIL